jgi:hypothetical protein
MKDKNFHFSGENIYAEIPTYIIPIEDKEKYLGLCEALKQELSGIDFTNKISFDDTSQTIQVYYYPRIFHSLLHIEGMQRCFHKYLEEKVTRRGCHGFNPYEILNFYINPQYKERNADNFNQAAKRWSRYVNDIETRLNYPITDFDLSLWKRIPHHIFGDFKEEFIGIGEAHDDNVALPLIEKNLAFLEEKGVRTLYLEGFPYEAQDLLDRYLADTSKPMPKELRKILIGRTIYRNDETNRINIVEKIAEQKLNIRVVGLDNCSTYLADESHCYHVELRIEAFNYIAYRIMMETRGDGIKIFLVGGDHLKVSRFGHIGIAALLDCANFMVLAEKYNESENVYVLPGIICQDDDTKFDFMKQMLSIEEYEMRDSLSNLIPANYNLVVPPKSEKNLSIPATLSKTIKLSTTLTTKIQDSNFYNNQADLSLFFCDHKRIEENRKLSTLGKELENSPNNIAALLARGEIYLKRKQYFKAYKDFFRANKQDPENTDALVGVERCQMRLKGYCPTKAVTLGLTH